MERSFWIPVAVAIALTFSVAAVARSFSGRDEPAERIEAQLAELTGRAASLETSIGSVRENIAAIEQETTQAKAAVRRLEEISSPPRNPAGQERSEDRTVGSSKSAPPEDLSTNVDEFARLMRKVLTDGSGGATPQEQERFWKTARSGDMIDRIIRELETATESDPDDLESRMVLADAYVAKLLTVPVGPERGVWGEKAEAQWVETAERDANHWDAHFKMGNNLSYYPPFLDRARDAIEWLEKGLAILPRMPVEERHVENFIRLSSVYQSQGDRERARTTLEAGLLRHPGDETLRSALTRLEESNR